jgi:hypothetical protein
MAVTDENGVAGPGCCHAIAAITTHEKGAEAAPRFLTPCWSAARRRTLPPSWISSRSR